MMAEETGGRQWAGVDQDGYRQILGVVEGAKEDAQSWRKFLRHLKRRGLAGVELFVSDTPRLQTFHQEKKSPFGMTERAIGEVAK